MTDRDLVISAVSNGSTYPAAGTTSYTGATSVIVYAIPNRGYILSSWTYNTALSTNKTARYTAVLSAGTNTLTPAFALKYTASNLKIYEGMKDTFRRFLAVTNFNVTLHALVLSTQDTDTGIPAKTYTDSTIEMMIINKDSKPLLTQLGKIVVLDALGCTASHIRVYDKVTTSTNKNYIISQVTPSLDGAGCLSHYECQLMEDFSQ